MTDTANRAVDPVHLLWTGGWDSSYRLMHLMFRTQAVVQPWYVIDEMRNSINREVDAMRKIRAALVERDPTFAARILPTRFEARENHEGSPQIGEMYRRLAEHIRLGIQYRYLAKLAQDTGVELELSVHDKFHGLGQALTPHLVRVETPHGPTLKLPPDSDPVVELFRPFSFPLLGLSKIDMGEEAAQDGFADMLELTWFCHTPRNGEPCGRCRPCQQVIQGNMHRRMPVTSRVLGQLRYWRRGIKSMFVGRAV